MAVSVLPSSDASGGEPGEPMTGAVIPALADGFLPRTETAPGLPATIVPGAIVVLAPDDPAVEAATRGVLAAESATVTGKTQIAAAYADWLQRSGAAVVWADASSRINVLTDYAAAAAELGAGAGAGAGQAADTAARRLLAALAESAGPWLVVLDGLRDPADVQGLVPRGPSGMILITTADAGLIPESWRATIMPVGPFSAREAMSYLRNRLTSDWEQRAGMINLVAEIGGGPGALAQASGVIAASPMTCRQYADTLMLRRNQMSRAAGAVPPIPAVTLALAVERADQLDSAAWPALVVAAALDGQRIPSAFFATSAAARYVTGESRPDPSAMTATLRLLAHVGLATVSRQPEGLAARISRPVVTGVRTAISREDYDRALSAAVAGVAEAWPDDEPPAWLGGMLASCSVSLWRRTGDRLWTGGSCPRLLHRTGDFMIAAGMLTAALAFWADVLATAERLLDPDHPDTLMIAGKVATLHLADGEPARAAARYEWIFRQLFRRYGADHPAPIGAQLDLGRALAAAGQFGEAVAVLDLAVTGYNRVLGPDRLETVGAAEDLAAACVQAGEQARAISLYQRALADRLRLQGDRHLDAITARQRLARAYLAAGDVKAAISEGKKVVADRQRELGKNHVDTIAAVGDLGAAMQAAGRTSQAVQMLEQARAGCEQILGPDHRDTLARCADLARAYYAIGWIVDAAVLLRDTAERCDRNLSPADPLTATVRDLLASVSGP